MCLPKQKFLYWQGCSSHISVNDRPIWGIKKKITLWLFNIAMENGPFIDGLPGLPMLNNQMVPLFPLCSHPCPDVSRCWEPEDVTIACTRNIFPAETLDFVMTLGFLGWPESWNHTGLGNMLFHVLWEFQDPKMEVLYHIRLYIYIYLWWYSLT